MKVLNGKVRHFKYTFFISNIVVERIYRNRFLELWKVASDIPFISLICLIIYFLKYITPISTKKVHLGKPLSHKYDIFVLLITKILLIKKNIHGEWQTRSESEPSSLLSEHEVILTSDWLDTTLFSSTPFLRLKSYPAFPRTLVKKISIYFILFAFYCWQFCKWYFVKKNATTTRRYWIEES